MLRSFAVACIVNAIIASVALAAGPFGTIHVGLWKGGAYASDKTGAFSHCAAAATYNSGISVSVGKSADGSWTLGFISQTFRLSPGESFPVEVTFDGQAQARLYATAISSEFVVAIMPPNVARDFRKATLMVGVAKGATYQFNLTSTGALLNALTNCVSRVKAEGLDKAGDFSVAVAKPIPPRAATSDSSKPAKPSKDSGKSGTGFVISASGHVVTNNHVVEGCREIRGNLAGEAPVILRSVSSDETNDLALLQGPAASFKDVAVIREKPIRSGDSVVAIGYPFHGLLTSDFTVTTGIVSSLSGLLNDTRFLQISAAVQPGNSGGPLLDTGGQIVGMVSGKLDTLKFVRVTGDIPENINFAIKTGAIRDFLDNSAVAYQIAPAKGDMKTAEIAQAARGYTLLISCTATEQAERARK
jgi:S1-C subfamily serine protease